MRVFVCAGGRWGNERCRACVIDVSYRRLNERSGIGSADGFSPIDESGRTLCGRGRRRLGLFVFICVVVRERRVPDVESVRLVFGLE